MLVPSKHRIPLLSLRLTRLSAFESEYLLEDFHSLFHPAPHGFEPKVTELKASTVGFEAGLGKRVLGSRYSIGSSVPSLQLR